MSENEAIQVRPEQAMSLNLKEITDRVNMVHSVLKTVFKRGTHYGTVPGCGSKMVLLKPGADVLAMTFRLVPSYEVVTTDLPNGHREITVTCSMTAPDGTLLGQGVGSASTMEKKYRYRKNELGEKIENEDIADTYNTVLKIAKKRAHVDATLSVTGAADIFTQDLIENEDAGSGEAPISAPRAKSGPAQPAQDGDTVTGTLETVSVKSGEKNGKAWTKYGLKVNGEWYNTFDSDIGEGAQALKGEKVTVTWKQDGRYKTAIGVSRAESPATDPAEADGDLLAYADGFPKMFAKGCAHVGIGVDDWQTAPPEALAKLKAWLNTESSRQ